MSATQNAPRDIEKLKEVEIEINLKGLWKGFRKICFDAPVDGFQWITRKTDGLSKRMMTGFGAVVTMPLGIMVRNGSTVAHDATDFESDADSGGFSRFLSGASGIAAGLGGAYYGGMGVYGSMVSGLGLTSAIGQGAAMIVGAVSAAFVAIPVATAGLLVASTTLGVLALTLSAVPAVANIPKGWSRTVARFKGNKINEAELQAELAKNSVSSRHERNVLRDANYAIDRLNKAQQKQILADLKEKFEPAAKRKAAAVTGAEVTPSAKPKAGQKPS